MSSNSLRIVIADNESIIRMDLRELLMEAGHEVVAEAGDGRQAIDLARRHRPDLVIMDIKMPEMDGLTAAKVISDEKIAPVLLLTAYSQKEIVDKAKESGVLAYLVKPVKEENLFPAMEIAMSRFQEFMSLEQELEDLKTSLEARKLLDRAKGVLMDAHGLTESEAQALLLAGLPSAATELGLGAASTSARLKLLAAVPDALREDADRVASRLHIDPVDWYRRAAPPAHLQAVAHAVWHQRVLAMRYDSWTGVRDRVVKPLGLVLKAGVWYMVALPQDGKQARTYRLSGIQALQFAKNSFAYPRKFRLVEFWQEATRRFESEIYRDAALLRANPRGLKKLADMSAAVNEAVLRTAVPEGDDGEGQRVRVPIESIEHACGQFLGAGADIEVLEPEALRARLREVTAVLQRRYARASPGGLAGTTPSRRLE